MFLLKWDDIALKESPDRGGGGVGRNQSGDLHTGLCYHFVIEMIVKCDYEEFIFVTCGTDK